MRKPADDVNTDHSQDKTCHLLLKTHLTWRPDPKSGDRAAAPELTHHQTVENQN